MILWACTWNFLSFHRTKEYLVITIEIFVWLKSFAEKPRVQFVTRQNEEMIIDKGGNLIEDWWGPEKNAYYTLFVKIMMPNSISLWFQTNCDRSIYCPFSRPIVIYNGTYLNSWIYWNTPASFNSSFYWYTLRHEKSSANMLSLHLFLW